MQLLGVFRIQWQNARKSKNLPKGADAFFQTLFPPLSSMMAFSTGLNCFCAAQKNIRAAHIRQLEGCLKRVRTTAILGPILRVYEWTHPMHFALKKRAGNTVVVDAVATTT